MWDSSVTCTRSDRGMISHNELCDACFEIRDSVRDHGDDVHPVL